MRHLIDEWIAKAKANRARTKAIEIIEESPNELTPFYPVSRPMGWDIESMEMGEITGAFRLIEREMDKATKGAKKATASAIRISNTIGMPPEVKMPPK
jgi:hypothetical protein